MTRKMAVVLAIPVMPTLPNDRLRVLFRRGEACLSARLIGVSGSCFVGARRASPFADRRINVRRGQAPPLQFMARFVSSKPVVNDLTIQAATVNGSGSQTANLVLTRAIFSMGIPVAPKNVFPSNIEGLPTWYQLRITPEGYQARKNKVDVLIALNPATWTSDLKNVSPGGAVIHEEAYSKADARQHLTYYAVPLAKL